jgi:hypothetical protein
MAATHFPNLLEKAGRMFVGEAGNPRLMKWGR